MIHIALNIQVAVPHGCVHSDVCKVGQTDKTSVMALQCTACPFFICIVIVDMTQRGWSL